MNDKYFSIARSIILTEGKYSNRKSDKGKETYKGISRKWNPDWQGWVLIDSKKDIPDFPSNLETSGALQNLVIYFYYTEYWVAIHGDSLANINYNIAYKTFDLAVNFGIRKSSLWLQIAINLLNRNEAYYKDITEDSYIGKQTLNTLSKSLLSNPPERILTILKCKQGCNYISIMTKDKTQEANVGWIDRIKL